MKINDKDGKKISPSTAENQETIIGLMGGGTGGKTLAVLSAEEIAAMSANKDLLVAALAGDFAALQAIITAGTQKTLVLDPAGAAIYPNGKPAKVQVRLTRPTEGSPVQYSINDMINSSVAVPVSVNLPGMALANGRGGYIMSIVASTNNLNLVDGIIRLWLYRTEPSGIVGDNMPMTNDDVNTTKGRYYIDIKFNSLLANSSVIIGQKEPVLMYLTDAASSDIKLRVQTLTAFTPVSAGWIDIVFTLLQL